MNMNYVLTVSVLVLAMFSAGGEEASIALFNGKDLSGWHADVPDADDNPAIAKSFAVREGNLVSLGEPRGHLITDAVYENYRLEVEYRFAGEPGNCGVLVHASTPRALYKMFPKSLEVQMENQNAGDFWCIVEDITVPDMEQRRGPKEKWGYHRRKGAPGAESYRWIRKARGGMEPNGSRMSSRQNQGVGERHSGKQWL